MLPHEKTVTSHEAPGKSKFPATQSGSLQKTTTYTPYLRRQATSRMLTRLISRTRRRPPDPRRLLSHTPGGKTRELKNRWIDTRYEEQALTDLDVITAPEVGSTDPLSRGRATESSTTRSRSSGKPRTLGPPEDERSF